ncbi:MAG: beta-galactosidase, partial [Eubacteriales bacterium]
MVKFTEKLWIRTVAFLLLLVLLLPPLASCAGGDKNDDDDGTTVESVDTIIEEKKVMLIENGKILYRVVRADKADPVAKKQAAKVANALSAVAGATAEIVTDWEDSAENSEIKEILVGATNREESRRAVEELEINDYLIRVTGNKIVICGGSEKAMDAAVDYFLLQYLGYLSESSFTVTKDLGIPETTDLKLTYEDEREIVLAVFNSTVTYADALKQALSSLGENIRLLNRTADILEALDADKTSLFILAGADTVPVGFNEKLDTYLKNSGRLITLGGPAFETVLYEQNGGSVLDRETYLASYMDKVDGAKVQTVLDTSSRSDVDLMTHSSDNGANVKTTIGSYGSTHSKYQLQVEVPSLSTYDLLTKSVKVSPGSAYGVGFYAKGSADTDRLYIEIKDKNGCRWFATVELTMEWKYYLLYASDFTYYATWEVKKVGTEVVFSNAATVSIGFAQNSAEIATGHHLYYLDRIQFIGYLDAIKQEKGLLIDGMAPETQVFPVTNASQMVTYSGQTILTDRNYAVPASSISCSSGRQGTGYNKDRSNRFIPLLEILDEKGLHAGYGAWINLLSGTGKRNGDYEGAVVGAVGATDNAFYNTEGIAAVVEMASAMLKDWFLLEGGTDEYIYPVQDSPTAVVGANYICLNENTEEKATVSVALYSGERLLKKWEQNSEGTSPASGGYYNLKGTYAIPGENPDRVVTTLSVNGSVRDRIEHSITLWSPKKESERQYVTTSDGHYMRGGKILNLYGINYMPTTSTAETDETDYDQYVKKSSYDPDVVWKDLLRLKEIGFNSVSIYVYYRNMVDCNNILDMIDKCDKLGLYVDLSIRSFAYPMDYRENEVETLINRLHFAEIDRIVAYDIAWEKAVGRYLENSLRKSWDADWREWINVQYGSLDNAEAAWGCKAPTDSTGAVIGATDAMLLESSSSALVAAYRRFVDDKVSEVFAEKTNHIRSLDPNHLVSFRMAYSGTPNHPANYFAYDYQSLASTLDFMSPEGYGVASN